jgi:hypothetical protein
MSASTPTVQGGIGTRQLGAALAGVGLALALVAGLAFGQLTATSQAPAAPAPAVAPNFDHGASSDSSNVSIAPAVAPNFDHGASSDSSNVAIPQGKGGTDHRRLNR